MRQTAVQKTEGFKSRFCFGASQNKATEINTSAACGQATSHPAADGLISRAARYFQYHSWHHPVSSVWIIFKNIEILFIKYFKCFPSGSYVIFDYQNSRSWVSCRWLQLLCVSWLSLSQNKPQSKLPKAFLLPNVQPSLCLKSGR